MIQKIQVEVACNTFQEAKSFTEKLAPDAKEANHEIASVYSVDWVPTGAVNFYGWRVNFIYSIKEICDIKWLESIIGPMYMYGVGDIDSQSN